MFRYRQNSILVFHYTDLKIVGITYKCNIFVQNGRNSFPRCTNKVPEITDQKTFKNETLLEILDTV